MTKPLLLTSFLLILVLASCKKKVADEDLNALLVGWEITKEKHKLDVQPRDVFFVNSEIGYIVGYNGQIHKTTDSGKSWIQQNSGTTLNLHSVSFIDENIGFASGEAMNCLDDDCGKGAVFLKTINGGETWSKTLFEAYTAIKSLHFFDESNGLALIYTPDVPNSRDYYISKTEDGGASWELIDLDIRPTYDKYFSVDDIVFMAGANQKIFKSLDWGNTWETINTPVSISNSIRNLYFYNENLGFIDGVTEIFKTTDGGLNWTVMNSPFSSFGSIHFYNESKGFNIQAVAAYQGGDFPTFQGTQSYQTNNGGEDWSTPELRDARFPSLTCFPERSLGFGLDGLYFYRIEKK